LRHATIYTVLELRDNEIIIKIIQNTFRHSTAEERVNGVLRAAADETLKIRT
jgi:hypothetical protein